MDMSKAKVERQNPTPPRGIVARFAVQPPYLPRDIHRFDASEPLTLENLISGHAIAIDGRWWDVLGCTSVNGWVSMHTTGPKLTAHESTPVHLAWREPASEPVATRV
jgi:hypothetical protein